ncbi:hypothetical protein BU16DRAFT_7191 [Lophium mytilinum]|uniref:GATA-type domain-containing protein n=1 Tax=Lophium mytilinum TaxID=390894 RepID=A0A6A6RD53_9PEZI|nr:hypothetical protein BU16DRAFT_7191 [Lophium mytilinum]
METLDAGSRQSVGLPSINYLESDKIKRDEPGFQRKHSAAAMASPSYPFPGPPPPYSNHQSTGASSTGALSGLISPPESRRTSSENEKEQRQSARQSLPSIHEALGDGQPLSYPAPPPSAPVSAPQHYQPSPATSGADVRPRTYSSDLQSQGPSNPYAHPRSPYTTPAPPSTSGPPPPPPPQVESLPRPPFSSSSHNPKLPTLHPLRTQSPPINASRPSVPYSPYSQQAPPSTYEPAPSSAGPMNPPYGGYNQYSQHYGPYSAPTPGAPGPVYPPGAPYSAQARYPPPSWRNDDMSRVEENKRAGRTGPPPYGDSVKRHLDTFDFEASLNEMLDGGNRVMHFTKHYMDRSHENQRSGIQPGSIPGLNEVDELMKHTQRIQDSLGRIRDVVVSQQTALAEQARDPYKPMNGYDHEPNPYHEDSKGGGGFAGSDLKKRRGRAAPPGRCHSCNRAETPEWRRGPDGARTLCNACGLHYAKLTRKMGGKATVGSSNLRPKSLGPGSPGA